MNFRLSRNSRDKLVFDHTNVEYEVSQIVWIWVVFFKEIKIDEKS